MVHNRYIYNNGLDIIVPVKHGTRWLEEKTNPSQIITNLFLTEIKNPITNKTYWVYRDSIEHLISALKTEIRTAIEFETTALEYIVSKFLKGKAHHWQKNTLEILYEYKQKYSVIPIHLSNLSSLFDPNIEFKKTEYEMNSYEKSLYNDDSFLKKYISDNDFSILLEMAKNDSEWINKL